jgi:hypothetical protein
MENNAHNTPHLISLNELDIFFKKIATPESIFHMHSSRSGPLLANEIYISIKGKKKNPNLELIKGLQQPNGTVAKFLSYWLKGLSSWVAIIILTKLKLNGIICYKDGWLNSDILNTNANSVHGNWSELVDALVLPLFLDYSHILQNSGFGINETNIIKEMRDNQEVSLETALTDISQIILNKILQKHNLPSFEIIRFEPDTINDLEFKYLNLKQFSIEFEYLIQKKINHYERAYYTIGKQLKSFSSNFPNDVQLVKILERIYRIDKSFKELSINIYDIKNHFVNPKQNREVIPSYFDQINCSIIAQKRSIELNIPKSDKEIYLDGVNMIKAMFNIAHQNNYFLILQEFSRGTDYNLYRELLQNYEGLNVDSSSCKIWDTLEFPEFDNNFIHGLKYLDTLN